MISPISFKPNELDQTIIDALLELPAYNTRADVIRFGLRCLAADRLGDEALAQLIIEHYKGGGDG